MNVKAVIFDVGETLVFYSDLLNWQNLYPAALKQVMHARGLEHTQERETKAQKILLKYNTRVNPREYEVSSHTIFSEILHKWEISNAKLRLAANAFYDFFSRDALCFEDAEYVLQTLKSNDIKIGVLTDVAYGMDNELVFRDLAPLMKYIDLALTSTDVGYRKPRTEGFLSLQKAFNLPPCQIACVGNEEKDIVGARNAGMISVLVNRDDTAKGHAQDFTVASLTEILNLTEIV